MNMHESWYLKGNQTLLSSNFDSNSIFFSQILLMAKCIILVGKSLFSQTLFIEGSWHKSRNKKYFFHEKSSLWVILTFIYEKDRGNSLISLPQKLQNFCSAWPNGTISPKMVMRVFFFYPQNTPLVRKTTICHQLTFSVTIVIKYFPTKTFCHKWLTPLRPASRG